ncbi:Polynucleotide 3'-phosphatase ZDP, partial [Mucuna pruriens]
MLRIPQRVAVNARDPNFRPLNGKPLLQMARRDSMMAEYAKSGRSSCKACSKAIEAKALRLALVSKSKDGYDVVKWHHLRCFPLHSHSHSSPHAIKGFSSLKSSDQEALKKLFAENDKSEEMEDVQNELQETEECDSKKEKVNKATEDVQNEPQETEERDSKKRKVNKETEGVQTELQETEEHDSKRKELCTSDVKAMVNIKFSVSDVKSMYKDANLLPKWKAFQTVIFLERDDGLHDSSKIAAFDFDGCLAKTALNRVGADAWSLMYSSIPDKLQRLYNDGYKLVIFTNESNIERWKNKRQVAVDSKIGRLNNFIEKVKVPVQVFIACGLGKSGKAVKKEDDPFRKPKPGMWHLMEQHFNSAIAIDMDQSFYVGDAAGRESDHSDADIKFAEDATLLPKWKAFQTVIFLERDDGLHDSSKIAAFDFDGCLAKTAVNIVGADAWSLMYSSIPDKLQRLYNDGYKLVIFTNESNIERWKNKRQVAVDSKIGRLNNFIEKVKVPVQVFIACGLGKSSKADNKEDDPFRKPKPGMWHLMEQHFNSGIAIDMDQSFYVGDAAGRESDHSDADIKFAEAIGLKFYVPEDISNQ